jgi:hypothetical protein
LPIPCAEGATCTIPASPELIIEYNALLERRESEVVTSKTEDEVVGEISYTLSLSAKPNRTVNVIVTKQAEPTADCSVRPDGLLFDAATYVFGPSNWNVPQAVQIDVRRNSSTFQGTSTARFNHKVTSKDSSWSSAFLRPMTVTIADDDECTIGARKYDDAIQGITTQDFIIRKCACTDGFYIGASDPLYCGSVTNCGVCPEGMLCGFQQNLTQAHLERGFYRTHNDVTKVVRCPGHSWQCIGNATHGDSLCSTGHEG